MFARFFVANFSCREEFSLPVTRERLRVLATEIAHALGWRPSLPGRFPCLSPGQGHVILGVNVLVLGYLPAAWLWDPRLNASSPLDEKYWQHIGTVAERGTLDALFLADAPGLGNPSYDAYSTRLEPTVNWAAVAAATEHIGLIATASTTFNDPFELAERLLSFDYASGGRAGWNIVTTRHGQAAGNFGLPDRGDRYERAADFVDLVVALWESAVTGREVDHHGSHFSLRGRLRVPPSPQRHPVLVQAGGSAAGRRLAGTRAEGSSPPN